MRLLKDGPYKTICLSMDQKSALASSPTLNPDGTNEFDLESEWYLTNDPWLDPEWDNRDDYWNKGEEYPYPFSLLIGGDTVEDHYESLSVSAIQRCDLGHLFD